MNALYEMNKVVEGHLILLSRFRNGWSKLSWKGPARSGGAGPAVSPNVAASLSTSSACHHMVYLLIVYQSV